MSSIHASADNPSSSSTPSISAQDLLLAYIVGLEVDPRVGLALYGDHMPSMGWHSGAVFGPPASAAAVSKLLKLPAAAIDDALGIACTQAGGLMSAQFESDVKRMQHGFASRSGLLGAMLARSGYTGIKQVFEREYGGFLKQFSSGNGMDPPYRVEKISHGLGEEWLMNGVEVKPYASMAGTHNTVDCLRDLRQDYPAELEDFDNIESISIELSKPAFEHSGWKAERPLTATGAQMNNGYVAATYIIDDADMPAQYSADSLDRDQVRKLVERTACEWNKEFQKLRTRVTICFKKGHGPIVADREVARGVVLALTNQEILEKWRAITANIIDNERRQEIEHFVLSLKRQKDISILGQLLSGTTKSPIA